MLLKAVSGLQRGDTVPAKAYITFVTAMRGADCAAEAKVRIKAHARSPTFGDAGFLAYRLEYPDKPNPYQAEHDAIQNKRR